MIHKHIACALLFAFGAVSPACAARVLTLDDQFREQAVGDPQISADGNWIAYSVTSTDLKEDESNGHIWMTSFDGARTIQLTGRKKESESAPRFSPDGRYLAFISGRGEEGDKAQVWLMDRAGGEAKRISEFKGDVLDLAWSPDSKKLALIVKDAKPKEAKKKSDATDADSGGDDKDGDDKKHPKPIVIDRFQFKEDIEGYLGKQRQHLYVFDLATRKADRLAPGEFNEYLPSWSPDGKQIAFVSRRARADFDRDENWDVYVVDAHAGAKPRALTTFPGPDNQPDWTSYPAWSPDGKSIAYIQGGPLKLIEYAVHHLAVIPAAGGTPKVLTASLDRNVLQPVWSGDGKTIRFLVEDDRAQYLASIPSAGGPVVHLAGARNVISAHTANRAGREALLLGTPTAPVEIYAFDGKAAPRQVSHQNEWLKDITLGAVEETSFKSFDGAEVHGYVIKPPKFRTGVRYPAILRPHGGPVEQWDLTYDFELQFLAANGYLAITQNPRGSSGRGEAWSKAIFADWGNRDAKDDLAAVDDAVRRGLADAKRLCVAGWSYGGMSTNYIIAQDTRFKCARSGASISDIFAGYGTDEYVRDYESELGVPWKNPETWTRISFPYLHADRIKTPVLFMGGDKDFNVPLLNVEQMYQALKSLGVETELVVYPGQFHELTQPSHQRDRVERDLAWFDMHLK